MAKANKRTKQSEEDTNKWHGYRKGGTNWGHYFNETTITTHQVHYYSPKADKHIYRVLILHRKKSAGQIDSFLIYLTIWQSVPNLGYILGKYDTNIQKIGVVQNTHVTTVEKSEIIKGYD